MVHQLTPQQLVAGRFRLVAQVAKGGTATVWRAVDTHAGGTVAVKFLSVFLDRGRLVSQAMEREVAALCRLDHERIVRPVHYDLEAEQPFIVTEFVEGVSLAYWMALAATNQEPIPLRPVAASVIDQVAAALEHAHAHRVVHRDIKPHNIQVTTWDPEVSIKVLDFGIARFLDAVDGATTQGRVLGSALYMAPEQMRSRQVGVATDVFALATLAFELLTLRRCWATDGTGQLPRYGEPLRPELNTPLEVMTRVLSGPRPDVLRWCPDLSETAASAITRGLGADPRQRPRSVTELARPFRALLARDEAKLVLSLDAPDSAFDHDIDTSVVPAPGEARTPGPEPGGAQAADPSPVPARARPTVRLDPDRGEPPGREASGRSWLLAAGMLLVVLAGAGLAWQRPWNPPPSTGSLDDDASWSARYVRYRMDPRPEHRDALFESASRLLVDLPTAQRSELTESLQMALAAGNPQLVHRFLRFIEDVAWAHRRLEPALVVGAYAKNPVAGGEDLVQVEWEDGQLVWRDEAGGRWSLEWKDGKLRTGADCPFGRLELTIEARRREGTEEVVVQSLGFRGYDYRRH